jgi:hypothetical protein
VVLPVPPFCERTETIDAIARATIGQRLGRRST